MLHKALAQGSRWGVVARNVTELIDPPRVSRKEMRALSPEEARRLLSAASGDPLEGYTCSQHRRSSPRRAPRTSMANVDLDGRKLHVAGSLQNLPGVGPTIVETKTARSRRLVVIGNVATEALRRHRASQAERRLRRAEACEHHDLVFPNTFGKPINPPNLLARSFRPLLERAGLPRMRFHDLRHTAATLCCSTRRTSEDRLRNAGALDDRDHPRLVLARQPYDARTGGAGAGFAVWLSTWLSNEYPVTR